MTKRLPGSVGPAYQVFRRRRRPGLRRARPGSAVSFRESQHPPAPASTRRWSPPARGSRPHPACAGTTAFICCWYSLPLGQPRSGGGAPHTSWWPWAVAEWESAQPAVPRYPVESPDDSDEAFCSLIEAPPWSGGRSVQGASTKRSPGTLRPRAARRGPRAVRRELDDRRADVVERIRMPERLRPAAWVRALQFPPNGRSVVGTSSAPRWTAAGSRVRAAGRRQPWITASDFGQEGGDPISGGS